MWSLKAETVSDFSVPKPGTRPHTQQMLHERREQGRGPSPTPRPRASNIEPTLPCQPTSVSHSSKCPGAT